MKIGIQIMITIMFGIGFSLFVSLAFAGVLSYYGKIIGTAQVSGPIFYADLGSNGATVGSLLLNTKPTSTYTTNFINSQSIIFWSGDLGGITFNYVPKCEFSVKIYSSQASNAKLICKYFDTSNNEISICEKAISTTTNWNVVSDSCQGSSTLNSVRYIVYEIKGVATPAFTFYVETNPNGDTRLQVTA